MKIVGFYAVLANTLALIVCYVALKLEAFLPFKLMGPPGVCNAKKIIVPSTPRAFLEFD